MINPIDKIKSGYSLYNSNYEYLGKSGEYFILNSDDTVKWIQLLDNSKYLWINGKLSRSYNRGFIITDYKLNDGKFKKPKQL